MDILPRHGHLHDFMESEDSGSTVFDAKAGLCGLFYLRAQAIFSLGSVIPIDVVFADIEVES